MCPSPVRLHQKSPFFNSSFTDYIDQIFPGYDKVFSDIGGVTSRTVLTQYPTPNILLTAERKDLEWLIVKVSSYGYSFASRKTEMLIQAAKAAHTLVLHSAGDTSIILSTISMLCTLCDSIKQIEQTMDDLITQAPELQKKRNAPALHSGRGEILDFLRN